MMKTTEFKMDALNQAIDQLSDKLGVHIYGMRLVKYTDPLKFGVNWSAKGTCTAQETLEFANNLKHAAMIASLVSSLDLAAVTVDMDDPIHFREMSADEYEEEFLKAVDVITDMLWNNMELTLADYIRA